MISLNIDCKLHSNNKLLRVDHWSKRYDQDEKIKFPIQMQLRSWEVQHKQKLLIQNSDISITFRIGKTKLDIDNIPTKALIDSLKGIIITDDNNSIVTEIILRYEPKLKTQLVMEIRETKDFIQKEAQNTQIDLCY